MKLLFILASALLFYAIGDIVGLIFNLPILGVFWAMVGGAAWIVSVALIANSMFDLEG